QQHRLSTLYTNSYSSIVFFFLKIPPPPRSTLFPYTTLFRSHCDPSPHAGAGDAGEMVCGSVRRVRERTAGDLARAVRSRTRRTRSEEHTSELQSRGHLVCRLLLEKKKKN